MSKKKSKKITYLDFEISFYENLLEDNPGFVDVLAPLGDAYTKRGLYEKGLDMDLRLSEIRTDDPYVFYNLACSYSLLKKTDLAIETLERAVSLGYDDFEWMNNDPDLENIRKDARYRDRFKAYIQN